MLPACARASKLHALRVSMHTTSLENHTLDLALFAPQPFSLVWLAHNVHCIDDSYACFM